MRPAHVFINGDCAYLKGLPADYANFSECLEPLDALNMQVHVTMGNHDDRQPMYATLSGQRPNVTSVTGKHLSVLEGINLPPVAYVFTEGRPNGWVSAKLGPSRMELQLHTLTPNHPRAEEVVVVKWS